MAFLEILGTLGSSFLASLVILGFLAILFLEFWGILEILASWFLEFLIFYLLESWFLVILDLCSIIGLLIYFDFFDYELHFGKIFQIMIKKNEN